MLFFQKWQATYPPLQLYLCKNGSHDLPTSKQMGMWGGINVSIVLCSLRRAKHQVTTTKWLLRSTGYLETRMTTTGWVLRWTPGDVLGQTTRRWNRLLDSYLHFYSNKLWHTERLKLSTFLCKCFFPRRQYFTRHEGFWKHIPLKQQKR